MAALTGTHRSLPDPDDATTRNLIGEAAVAGEAAATNLAASIMSSVVAYLVAGVGPEKTAAILRDWAAAVVRRKIK